ncbi:hypothetical protein [Streptomyces sp. NPDC020965]
MKSYGTVRASGGQLWSARCAVGDLFIPFVVAAIFESKPGFKKEWRVQ